MRYIIEGTLVATPLATVDADETVVRALNARDDAVGMPEGGPRCRYKSSTVGEIPALSEVRDTVAYLDA